MLAPRARRAACRRSTGFVGLRLMRFNLLNQGFRYQRVFAFDQVPSSTTMPWSEAGSTAAPLRSTRPWSAPAACRDRGRAPPTFERRCLPRPAREPGRASSSPRRAAPSAGSRPGSAPSRGARPAPGGAAGWRTRRVVGYETTRSHTQAKAGRRHVAQEEPGRSRRWREARTPPPVLAPPITSQRRARPSHTVTGGTKTDRTSPHWHGR